MPELDHIDACRRNLGMSIRDLWVGYCGLGGDRSQDEVRAWFAGRAPISPSDFDLLAQSVNDRAAGSGLAFPARYLDGS